MSEHFNPRMTVGMVSYEIICKGALELLHDRYTLHGVIDRIPQTLHGIHQGVVVITTSDRLRQLKACSSTCKSVPVKDFFLG